MEVPSTFLDTLYIRIFVWDLKRRTQHCKSGHGHTKYVTPIPALDPARPLVRGPNKLRAVDANVVQVIHTNAGQFGEAGRLGIIDFCVNGGREQPSCANTPSTNVASFGQPSTHLAGYETKSYD